MLPECLLAGIGINAKKDDSDKIGGHGTICGSEADSAGKRILIAIIA
jgi:hypothetical protein